MAANIINITLRAPIECYNNGITTMITFLSPPIFTVQPPAFNQLHFSPHLTITKSPSIPTGNSIKIQATIKCVSMQTF